MYRSITILGNIVQVRMYQYYPHILKDRQDIGRKKDKKAEEDNYLRTGYRRRRKIRELINCNFNCNSKFITLTFRDSSEFDVTDLDDCNKKFKQFIQRMRRKYGDFRYISVPEFQDSNNRGAVHYHMVSDLPYIPWEELREIWQNGNIDIRNIEDCDNVGAYISAYLTKNPDERLLGRRAVMSSKGLKRPDNFSDWDIKGNHNELIDEYILNNLAGKSPSYTKKFDSEYLGEISFYEYNLNKTDN